MRSVRSVMIVLFLAVAASGFADGAIPDGFWQSALQIRDGISDFGGRTVAALFRDVQFQQLGLPSGSSMTFTIAPKSFDGADVVLEYSVLYNGVVSEYFDFHFKYKGAASVLYMLSRGEAKLEGYDQMRRIMKEFYIPSLVSN